VLALLLSLALLGCGTQPSVPISDRSVNVDERVREPAASDGDGLQIRPLQSPGVETLLADAETAEAAGDLERAGILLERALRLQPGDPDTLQRMAELELARGDYEQALARAARSYDLGPKLGELCSRNWHTIAVARDHLEDPAGAEQARTRAAACARRPAPRL
jgi:tetratricopeptide (TPR) repeat protein